LPSNLDEKDLVADSFQPVKDTCLEEWKAQKQQAQERGGALGNAGSNKGASGAAARAVANDDRRALTDPPPPPPPRPVTTLRVCLSPGCVSDGAAKTYEQLLALAPPHVVVLPGTCHSLCGSGPVVDRATAAAPDLSASEESNSGGAPQQQQQRRIRRVSGAKVLEVLESEGVQPELAAGYEWALQGDAAYAAGRFEEAIDRYGRAVRVAFRPALDAQADRERLRLARRAPTNTGVAAAAASASSSAVAPLEWLVRARRNTALSHLRLGVDLESALLEAQAACNLSRNTCWRSFAAVAQIYRKRGDGASEYETLRTLFALPVGEGEAALDFASRNDRREMQFRMQRLARDLRGQQE
jgi:tetratricopeptide (TPR) repeat protein